MAAVKLESCYEWYLTLGVWMEMVASSSHWRYSFGLVDGVTLKFLVLVVESSS